MSLHSPVDPSRDHTQGPADAPVTLVEYGDYECSYCGQAFAILETVLPRLGDKVRFVFRNFPLTEIHPHAAHAALAAETAAEIGGEAAFWPMHDALYTHQRSLSDSHLHEIADSVGVDGAALLQSVRAGGSETAAGRVQEDFLSGVRSGVNGTPTFFINGTRYDASWDAETLAAALEAAAAG